MPKTHQPYPSEFRSEAVHLATSPGHTISGVSRDLGISSETLRKWVRQDDVDAGRSEGLTTEERSELTALRRRVRTLETEREILKRAAAFFAKETDPTR